MIIKETVQKAYSYANYRKMIDALMAENKTTGTDQSEDMVAYGRINIQRMQRLEKTVGINNELKEVLNKISKPLVFLVITEGWCGDAAQNVPVFHFMEKLSPCITLKLILRDENPEVMDKYLTNGSRSIPKLICLDKETREELFVWGPRPAACQQLMLDLKARNATKKEKGEAIHLWYARDKTESLQREITELLKAII